MSVAAELAAFAPLIRSEMERWNVPGLGIGLMIDGEMAAEGFGVANLSTGVATTADTLFQIGSISKVFTATLVMTLVDAGLVDLDTPIARYLTKVTLADRVTREGVTLRHLLTHMGGFYGDRFEPHGDGDDALARAVAAMADLPQQTAIGELWTYCNAGFDLAGRVVEVVLGQTFESAMRERVFTPLGLHKATYFAGEAIRHAVAAGHIPRMVNGEPDPTGVLEVAYPWPIPRRSSSAGAVSATPTELLRFALMHANDGAIDGVRVIESESALQMRTVQVDADPFRFWGIGWSRRNVGDVEIAEHNGATNGFMARLTTVPSKRFALAVLTNSGGGSAAHGEISRIVLERLLGAVESHPPVVQRSADDLKRRVGTYRQPLGDLTLSVDGNGYRVERMAHSPFSGRSTPQSAARFEPVSDVVMASTGGGTEGSFADWILNPDGSARFLRFGGRLHFPV